MHISGDSRNAATTSQRRAEYFGHYLTLAEDEESSRNSLLFALVGLGIILLIGMAGLIQG